MAKDIAEGKWIWYPDDFEIELSARFMLRRYERDVPIPPFWKQYSCWRNVKFLKRAKLTEPETLRVCAEGVFNVTVDGAYVYGAHGEYELTAGEHEVVISVAAEKGLPAVKADGNVFSTDGSWLVTCNDHNYVSAAFNDALVHGDSTPNNVKLAETVCEPVRLIKKGNTVVYDFGRELFARVRLCGAKKGKTARIYYGESEEEACDFDCCELTAELTATGDVDETDNCQAFRFLAVKGADFSSLQAVHEYLPQPRSAKFDSSDSLLNKIFDVSQYTLSLTNREFIIDGIKRDRWVWSGDAYQGYLMNYYCFFDKDAVRRTMLGLFGREPFDLHLNHIMDYTFYWIMGFCDYYRYTGDREFTSRNISKAVSALEYCIARADENGLMKGLEGDWVFIDWADNLDNTGEVSFENMLYCISLGMLAELLRSFDRTEEAERYEKLRADVAAKLEKFWDEEKGAYIHSFKNGVPDGKVFRYANIFAIIYDLCPPERQKRIAETVLKSDSVQAITTPYMRFYELAALMKTGETEYVLDEIRDYWGGMLGEGATTFWETYDKRQKGAEKYAMYGRRYGKSLCHTWGASPLYLLGKYVAGLEPADCGNSFVMEPKLAGLERLNYTVPFGDGEITLEVENGRIKVFSTAISGTLVWNGKRYRVEAGRELTVATVPAGKEYAVQYENV